MKRTIPALLCIAAALCAQTSKTLLGTVTEFKTNSFEMGVKSDAGETEFFPFGTDTQVVQIPPGERDLGKATPVAVTGILQGDRVMVSFAAGMREARRIVLISSRDIVKRNEAEKLDWKTRGISGIATSQNAGEITVEVRTPQGAHTAIVTITEKTKIRRYAPDSVKFSDAIPARIADIAPGDQVRSRGLKSEDGSRVNADEVVFGTFLTRMGAITSIHPETGEIEIQDVTTKKPLTVRVTADSQLKMMPDMRAMLAPRPAAHTVPAATPAKFDIQSAMERLPAAKLDDLKVGSSIIVTSTKGVKSDAVTAILLLANADFLVKMAQGQSAGGESGMDAINRLHGGMLSSPTGSSPPHHAPVRQASRPVHLLSSKDLPYELTLPIPIPSCRPRKPRASAVPSPTPPARSSRCGHSTPRPRPDLRAKPTNRSVLLPPPDARHLPTAHHRQGIFTGTEKGTSRSRAPDSGRPTRDPRRSAGRHRRG